MAYYNNQTNQIEYFKEEPHPNYKGWKIVDCGCCNGMEWNSCYEPRDCKRCGGMGYVTKHIKTGVTKDYPGGRFV